MVDFPTPRVLVVAVSVEHFLCFSHNLSAASLLDFPTIAELTSLLSKILGTSSVVVVPGLAVRGETKVSLALLFIVLEVLQTLAKGPAFRSVHEEIAKVAAAALAESIGVVGW